jgi:hypothetical protein
MFIPFIKDNEDLIIENRKLSNSIVEYLKKKELSEDIINLEAKLNKILKPVFSFEFENVGKYKKVYGFNSEKVTLMFLVDMDGCFNMYHFRQPLNIDYANSSTVKHEYLKNTINEILSKSRPTGLSPYVMNETIEKLIKSYFSDIERDFGNEAIKVSTHIYYKYNRLFKNEIKYFSSYIKNKMFSNVDKSLFKELYSYHLHFKETLIYNNYLKSNKKIRDNFLKFKKEHNFLSMVFADKKRAVFNVMLNNYDSILNNIAMDLNVSHDELAPLQFKNYNDFLYMKTPKKYFTILQKYGLKITHNLNLKQIKFLTNLVYKNRTFVKPQDIYTILNDEELLDKFDKIFMIRKSMNISHLNEDMYETLEDYMNETIMYFENGIENLYKNYEGGTSIKSVQVPFVYVDEDNKKMTLTPVSVKPVLDVIKNYVLNGDTKKVYSNLQYWDEFITLINKTYKGNSFVFEFKENRQKHFVIMSFHDNSVGFMDQILTPRVSKKLKALLGKQEFIDYLFKAHIMKEVEF